MARAGSAPGGRAPQSELRNWMAQYATGVTVVLVQNQGKWHGMTANAFTSVSLDPPQVLLCVKKGGRTHPLLLAQRRFIVCVLAHDQEDYARRFASDDPERQTVADNELTAADSGLPYLRDSLAFLDCGVRTVHEGGDHSIFLAEVLGGGTGQEAKPLIFHAGQFCTSG